MKKSIVVALILTTLGLSGIAQEKQALTPKKSSSLEKEISVDQRVKNQSDRAEKELGLNSEQKLKWEAALRERITANKPIKEKLRGATTPEERKQLNAEAKSNMKKFDDTVGLILTPEQKAKYEAKKKEKKDNFEKRKTAKKSGTSAADEVEALSED